MVLPEFIVSNLSLTRRVTIKATASQRVQSIQPGGSAPKGVEYRDLVRQIGKKCFQSPCLSAILATEDRQASKSEIRLASQRRKVSGGPLKAHSVDR